MPCRFPLRGKWSVEHPYTLIDHQDVEGKGEWRGLRFRDYSWHVTRIPSHGHYVSFYVRAKVNGRHVLAHRFLTGKRGMDHADRDPFNNTSLNFREASGGEQQANHGLRSDNKSGLVGVSQNRLTGKWRARIQIAGRVRFLGYFDDKNEAARVRDKAASEAWGEFAYLNFPDEMRAA